MTRARLRRRPGLRERASSQSRRRLVALALVTVVALLVGVALGRLTRPATTDPGDGERPPATATVPVSPARVQPELASPGADPGVEPEIEGALRTLVSDVSATLPGQRRGLLALIIDDLGRDHALVEELGGLGVELSYAVLPYEPETLGVATRLAARGAEILVHLPMEPGAGADPGPGALYVAMSPAELRERTRAALAAVPGAVGLNNHMGSVFSTDRKAMRPVLEALAERGLFFVDSRTSAESVGASLARELGVPTVERQVFLDREAEPLLIREQFERFQSIADESGWAVGIAHPYPETLAVLRELVPEAQTRGYRFVRVSALLQRSGLEGME